MNSPIVCAACMYPLKNPLSTKFKCDNCWYTKRVTVFNIKEFVWEENYYWLDSIIRKLGNDFDKYIENFWREGIIFTRNKNRGYLPSRLWRLKKYIIGKLKTNWLIEYGTLDAIKLGIPVSYEQAYLMIKEYLWWEDRATMSNTKTRTENKIEYLDDETYLWIRFMCNKYHNVLQWEITLDDNEELVMFTLENKINMNTIVSILWQKRITKDKYPEILEIYNKYKRLSGEGESSLMW